MRWKQSKKHVRMVTGKHLPVNFAEWTLESMYFGIEYWATEYYDQERHPVLDCSPRDAFLRGLKECGSRPQRQILFNNPFHFLFQCPDIGLGDLTIQQPFKIHAAAE